MSQTPPFTIRPEDPADDPAVESLNDLCFGPGRYARAAYRLREGAAHDRSISFVGEVGDQLIGSVRLTGIAIGGRDALLLGPLAVDPAWRSRGCGRALVRAAVEAARIAGHRLILLVGDEPYYWPMGFRRVEPRGAVTLPGPVDPARVLVAELDPGAAEGLSGPARRIG